MGTIYLLFGLFLFLMLITILVGAACFFDREDEKKMNDYEHLPDWAIIEADK